jgi:N,N'-diacetyllegionaminate synthase
LKSVKIGAISVGEGHKCFIIAEAGVNHNGSVKLAKQMIERAKAAGADAIKFQTFKTEAIVTRDAGKADYQKASTDESTQYDMIKKLELSESNFRKLKEHADEVGIMFLSTPFDEQSADMLAAIGMPAYKVASGEITNFPLLRHLASKDKPIIISTGMSTIDEIKAAIKVIRAAGQNEIIALHCTTSYPARMDDLNLRAMQTMREDLDIPVGYSDHSLGITAPIAAVALAACIIEKHFTLDRNMVGPDHAASLEPKELAEMALAIRDVEKALGSGVKEPTMNEKRIMQIVRKSIVADRDIAAGATITKNMLAAKRPGNGIHPEEMSHFIGRKAKHSIKKDKQLDYGDVE